MLYFSATPGIVKFYSEYVICMALRINEIFYSIQGESTAAGLPFIFTRLTGCNLRCSYCDTPYAYDDGDWMEIDAIVQRVSAFGCRRVTVTGGEPLDQAETPALIVDLLDKGYDVSIETNGSLDVSGLDPRCTKVMDIKCPSSGMHLHHLWSNLTHLASTDQIKFVIADWADFEFARQAMERLSIDFPRGNILFSPAYRRLAPDQLADWMLKYGTDARLQIQLHKYLWPDIERGV